MRVGRRIRGRPAPTSCASPASSGSDWPSRADRPTRWRAPGRSTPDPAVRRTGPVATKSLRDGRRAGRLRQSDRSSAHPAPPAASSRRNARPAAPGHTHVGRRSAQRSRSAAAAPTPPPPPSHRADRDPGTLRGRRRPATDAPDRPARVPADVADEHSHKPSPRRGGMRSPIRVGVNVPGPRVVPPFLAPAETAPPSPHRGWRRGALGSLGSSASTASTTSPHGAVLAPHGVIAVVCTGHARVTTIAALNRLNSVNGSARRAANRTSAGPLSAKGTGGRPGPGAPAGQGRISGEGSSPGRRSPA